MVHSTWKLVEESKYQTAIEEYTRLYEEKQNNRYLSGRALAYLFNKNYWEAIEDWSRVIKTTELKYRSSYEYLYMGICYWYLAQYDQTIKLWKEALSLPYTDAAGGVQVPALLLYAAERLDQEELRKQSYKELKRHWQNYRRRMQRKPFRRTKFTHSDFMNPGLLTWPGPIVPLLLDKIDAETFQEIVENSAKNPTLKKRRQCQADFYVAMKALQNGDNCKFYTSMEKCANNEKGKLEEEFFLAMWEVEHSFPEIRLSE